MNTLVDPEISENPISWPNLYADETIRACEEGFKEKFMTKELRKMALEAYQLSEGRILTKVLIQT